MNKIRDLLVLSFNTVLSELNEFYYNNRLIIDRFTDVGKTIQKESI